MTPVPLSPDADFSPFGQLIRRNADTVSTFSDAHFTYWKQQAILSVGGDIEVGILQVKKHEMLISKMEKHDRSPELLIPVAGDFIISVADTPGESPLAKDLKAFHIAPGTAVLLNRSCWHWMPCPTGDEATILIIFKDNTSADDLIIRDLDSTCILTPH